MRLTNAQKHSIHQMQQAIATIEQLVPQERKRSSKQRRRWLEQAHEVFRVHCPKLALSAPSLGHFYRLEQFLANARLVADSLQPWLDVLAPWPQPSEERNDS